LNDILPSEFITSIEGDSNIPISGISLDSRKVEDGYLFAALPGTQTEGSFYMDDAIAKGASAVLCEKLPEKNAEGITYLVSNAVTKAIGLIASRFYDFPSTKLNLIGITGTNGKTTTATLL